MFHSKAVYTLLFTASVMALPSAAEAQTVVPDSGQDRIQFALPTSPNENIVVNDRTVRERADKLNPWDYEAESQPAATAPVVTDARPKHWTEMTYPELLVEVERTDMPYTDKTRAEMRLRLKALEASANSTDPNLPPVVIDPNQPVATGTQTPAVVDTTAGKAPAVVVVPAVTTPWWKLPKSEQAAARAVQEGGAAAQKPVEELSPRERIYRNIQKNRTGG